MKIYVISILFFVFVLGIMGVEAGTQQWDFGNLAQEKEKYEIQQNALTLARQRVEVMALLLQAGQATIRDQLEAQADLVSAQNSVTRAMVNYHTARWNLLKNLGILDVENGKFWLNDLAGPAGDGPLGGNGALLEVVSPASVFGEE